LRFVVHPLSHRFSHAVRISGDLFGKTLNTAFRTIQSAALPLRQRRRRHFLWHFESTRVRFLKDTSFTAMIVNPCGGHGSSASWAARFHRRYDIGG
jgi:hypothetical protein